MSKQEKSVGYQEKIEVRAAAQKVELDFSSDQDGLPEGRTVAEF